VRCADRERRAPDPYDIVPDKVEDEEGADYVRFFFFAIFFAAFFLRLAILLPS